MSHTFWADLHWFKSKPYYFGGSAITQPITLYSNSVGEVILTDNIDETGDYTFKVVVHPEKPTWGCIEKGTCIVLDEEIKEVNIVSSRKPIYPAEVCREPYCFIVNNEEEEIQMNDFLGIDPIGVDIDTYLSKLTRTQLAAWKKYWVNVWTNFKRSDIVSFVKTMYNKYY